MQMICFAISEKKNIKIPWYDSWKYISQRNPNYSNRKKQRVKFDFPSLCISNQTVLLTQKHPLEKISCLRFPFIALLPRVGLYGGKTSPLSAQLSRTRGRNSHSIAGARALTQSAARAASTKCTLRGKLLIIKEGKQPFCIPICRLTLLE